jgi:probable O-glycosylation ligase (exosortase A-associated)
MRDILLLVIVLYGLSKTFSHPYIGTYLWTWISLMSPHRLAYGFAYSFPFALLIAGITLVGLITGKQKKLNIWSRETITLALLILWVCITTIFAVDFDAAAKELDRFIKIQLFIFLSIALISDKKKLDWLIWVIVASIGFYGIKGGIFTIATGGGARVWGPEGSFIGGNNEVALAILMVIPLMRYLQLQTKNIWLKRGLIGSMLLSSAAVLGTQSRGALLGISAIGLFFWLKSKQKLSATIMVGIIASMVMLFMPQTWWDRMNTIQTYEQDASAMGRINAWWVAYGMANDRITGGGANMFNKETFQKYAPVPEDIHDVHSIYFEMLGEQGWIGLAIFLTLGILTWSTCSRIAKEAKNKQNNKWLGDLMPMLQVSLIGYYSAGTFLGLSYYDLYYDLIAITVIASKLATTQILPSNPNPLIIKNKS